MDSLTGFTIGTLFALFLTFSLPLKGEDLPISGDDKSCRHCHPQQEAQFSQSAMARAASNPTFIAEWKERDEAHYCLNCHAPSGGQGLQCDSCHSGGEHPYEKIDLQRVCGTCHDSPGENTFRLYRQRPGQLRDRDCLDCHTPGISGFSHHFKALLISSLKRSVARLRMLTTPLHPESQLTIFIEHRAGHALPGGTTGRSAWLELKGYDRQQKLLWQDRVRYGWLHQTDGSWHDETLKPGQATIYRRFYRQETDRIEARLIYQRKAGDLDLEGLGSVLLAEESITIQPKGSTH